jgi:D-alanyl-lipoteichoic acid acyltransferase DltB (MBOAT superfamily)
MQEWVFRFLSAKPMLFDSVAYVLFLLLVVLLCWRLNFRNQNRFLLAASYFFYGWWDWRFLLLMIASTTLDYFIALRIDASGSERARRTWLTFSLIVNFSVLGFFKYFNFFLDSSVHVLQVVGLSNLPLSFLKIILPPGISFYTFQEVAYIVDVYHRKLKPADRYVDYALFVSLFPHLIAGPIQRPSHLLPQVQHPRTFDSNKAFDGLILILEGLFRKCVVADNCALIANSAFNGTLGPPSLAVTMIGVYAFAWQIYGDFSGYSSIARGSAQLLGFHFMVNFRQPYFAQTLQDFWRRWHISLSTWLREYLYIPLGGNRHGSLQTYRNLMLTMLLGGLWHGASWTFVVWGGIHGGGLAAERLIAPREAQANPGIAGVWLRRIFIFHLVCLAWIFFRATTVAAAWDMLASLRIWYWGPECPTALRFLTFFILPLFALDLWLEKTGDEYLFESRSVNLRVAAGFAIMMLVTFFSANQPNAFIYFQF